MRRVALLVYTIIIAAGLGGCRGSLFGINLFVVDQRTALEEQVLGNYRALGQNMTAVASVRGVAPDGSLQPPPPMTDSQRAVLQAMNNRRYNRDDVDALLRAGVVGEGNGGLLVPLVDPLPEVDGLSTDLVARIIEEENRDRQVVIDRLVATTPGVTADQRGDVAFVFARLNQDSAPAGARLQGERGGWSTK